MDVNLQTGHPPQVANSNPTLYYRLDPCEPGMLREASASQSVAAVSAHERGNLNQFRREAALAGRMVVQSSITFTRGIDGMFPSIRAGRTEVVTVPLPSRLPDLVTVPVESAIDPDPVEAPASDPSPVNKNEYELLAALSSLSRRLQAYFPQPSQVNEVIKQNLSGIVSVDDDIHPSTDEPPTALVEKLNPENKRESFELLDPDIVVDSHKQPDAQVPDMTVTRRNASFDDTRYRQELEKVHEQLNELMAHRVSVNIEQLSKILTDIIQQNLGLITGLIQVANRISPEAQFNDLSGTVPILGSALDFSA